MNIGDCLRETKVFFEQYERNFLTVHNLFNYS